LAQWKRDSWGEAYWLKHKPSFGSAMGGEDGLGIYFSETKNLEIITSSFYTADNFNKTYNSNLYPEKSAPQGVYYKAQDHLYSSLAYEYTWDKAYLTVWHSFKVNVNTVARTHWTHTWSSAKISGVGLTTTGFNISISNSNSGNSYDGVTTSGSSIIYP